MQACHRNWKTTNSFSPLLYIVFHKLFRILFKHFIYLVQQIVYVFLYLLTFFDNFLSLSCAPMIAPPYPARFCKSSSAVSDFIIILPTMSSDPLNGLDNGTLLIVELPTSNSTDVQLAAYTSLGNLFIHVPLKNARVSRGGVSLAIRMAPSETSGVTYPSLNSV